MKLFNYEIKKIEKRNTTDETIIPGTSLGFGSITNKYAAMNISAVYRAVDLISDSIAALPIYIQDEENNEEVKSHSLNLVFKNLLQTKYNFIKMLIKSVILKGNGFAYIERASDGTVTNLRFLESGDVQIHYDKKKNELWYMCPMISSKKIEPINMIHLVKNSWDGVNGVSVLTFAARSLSITSAAENAASKFYDNGCNLSGYVTGTRQLSASQIEQLKTAWNTTYTQGGSGIAFLPGDLTYTPISVSASDAQLLESRLFNVQDIARFFGINPVLLGDLSHGSYSTIEAAQTEFLVHTLQPYIDLVEAEFSRKLIKPSESALAVNLDETYMLRTDKTAQASYYSTLVTNGILSINEVRNELGYNEIEGADKPMVAYTKVEDNTIGTNNNNKKEDE